MNERELLARTAGLSIGGEKRCERAELEIFQVPGGERKVISTMANCSAMAVTVKVSARPADSSHKA